MPLEVFFFFFPPPNVKGQETVKRLTELLTQHL